jgi:hypothetical protein
MNNDISAGAEGKSFIDADLEELSIESIPVPAMQFS